MKNSIKPVALGAAAVLLGMATQAGAAVSNSVVSATMGRTFHTCLQGLSTAVGDGENCMYDGGPSAVVASTPFGETTGPWGQGFYYDSLATPAAFSSTPSNLGTVLYTPTLGDGKISPLLNGTVTVDDAGDGFGANDLLSFTLTMTSPGEGDIVRWLGSSVVEKFTSMTQVMAPRTASSVSFDELTGQTTYVIASEGFPTLLNFNGFVNNPATICRGQWFGSVECGHSFSAGAVDPDFWMNSSAAGLGSLESNLGAQTTGTLTGLGCIEAISPTTGVANNDCQDSKIAFNPLASDGVAAPSPNAETVGWDQLLLRVVIDDAGNVVWIEGFDVQDYPVFGSNAACGDALGTNPACNTWVSGYFATTLPASIDAVPLPAGAWLVAPAVLAAGRFARRRKTA